MGDLVLNGVHYSTSGNLYNPVIYSDTERKIGVWRDNKPLYQKTIDFGALPNADQKAVNHNIADLDKLVSVKAVANGATNKFSLSYIDTNSLANGIGIYVSNTAITIRCGSNRSSYNAYVTLQYTKTTDTAGSGNWNTDGIPTVHYDGNEKVIGTWFGQTLYEKTINSSVTIPSNDSVDFSLSGHVSNVSDIISCSVYDATNKRTVPFFTIQTFSNYGVTVFSDAINGVITFSRGSAGAITINCYITIQYTKTTD